jgi:FAD/FMN-containing dehydrogenase
MPVPIGESDLRRLRARFGDAVVTPADAGYDAARAVWNARFDRRPAAIVRCRSADDVQAAVGLVRERDLLFAVRSGGHDYAGNSTCEAGLVVDLSPMKAIDVDVDGRRAAVQPGVTWAELDRATAAHGLATTGGTVSTVGVAGFTLGGGTGWLSRGHGLAVDNLLAADVVTATGERVRASAEENPDLFWALRGGSGNFGIVTSFVLRLHPAPEHVLGGQILFPHSAAGNVLRLYRAYMAAAPDEVCCYPFFYRVPPIQLFPETLHGKTTLALVAAWTGEPAGGEAALAPLRDFGEPSLDTIARLSYVDLQQSFDAGMAKGSRWYSRAVYLDALSDETIDTVVRRTENLPGEFTTVYFEPMGGAIGRVDPAATAFPHRRAAFGLHVFPGWRSAADDEANMAWANAFFAEIVPHGGDGGVYVNLLGGDEPERVPAAFGSNYSRLRQLKRRFDPDNLFRSNHNIPPAD